MIKVPKNPHLKDPWGSPLYIDVLALREASQLADLMGIPGYGRGAGALAKSKLNFGIGQVIDQLSNSDYTGKPITAPTKAVPFLTKRLPDRAGHFFKGFLPTAVREDVRKPAAFGMSQLLGAPLRRGTFVQPGFTAGQSFGMKEALQQQAYEKQKVQEKVYLSTNLQLMAMLKRGEITPDQYRNALMQRRYPQSHLMKRNKRRLYRSGYFDRR